MWTQCPLQTPALEFIHPVPRERGTPGWEWGSALGDNAAVTWRGADALPHHLQALEGSPCTGHLLLKHLGNCFSLFWWALPLSLQIRQPFLGRVGSAGGALGAAGWVGFNAAGGLKSGQSHPWRASGSNAVVRQQSGDHRLGTQHPTLPGAA